MLHTEIAEETSLLPQLAQNFIVDLLDLVEYFLLLQNVAESLGFELIRFLRVEHVESLVHLRFVVFLEERVDAVFACDEA